MNKNIIIGIGVAVTVLILTVVIFVLLRSLTTEPTDHGQPVGQFPIGGASNDIPGVSGEFILIKTTTGETIQVENFLTDPGQTCDALRSSWDCYGAGTKLSLGGSSGFDAIRAGDHETNGELSWYDKREPSIHFWSSSPCLNCSNWSHGFSRSLINGGNDPYVARGWGWMVHGISVRCLADTTNTP